MDLTFNFVQYTVEHTTQLGQQGTTSHINVVDENMAPMD